MFNQLKPVQLIRSTRSAFWIPGFAAASWAPLIPFIKSNLSLTEDHLGYVLMCAAVGAVTTLLYANPVISRFGCRALVRFCGAILACCLVGVTLVNNVYLLGLILFIFGAMSEGIAIAANVNAAAIEKYLDKSLMSGFHGLYSLANAVGVFVVASMLSANIDFINDDILLTAATMSWLVLIYCSQISSRHLITDMHATEEFLNQLQAERDAQKAQQENQNSIPEPPLAKHNTKNNSQDAQQAKQDNLQVAQEIQNYEQVIEAAQTVNALKVGYKTAASQEGVKDQENKEKVSVKSATPTQTKQRPYFLHPMLLLLGFICFVMFVTEGSMLDWTGVFLSQYRGVALSEAGYGFAAFAIMMTACRLMGDRVVTFFGRRRVLTMGGILVTAGICLAVTVPHPMVAVLGFGLVGVGASNIVPQSVSYAATVKSVPLHKSVFVVNAIGYIGGLFGPAVIGFSAHRIGLDVTFIILSIGTAIVATAAYLKIKSGPLSSISN